MARLKRLGTIRRFALPPPTTAWPPAKSPSTARHQAAWLREPTDVSSGALKWSRVRSPWSERRSGRSRSIARPYSPRPRRSPVRTRQRLEPEISQFLGDVQRAPAGFEARSRSPATRGAIDHVGGRRTVADVSRRPARARPRPFVEDSLRAHRQDERRPGDRAAGRSASSVVLAGLGQAPESASACSKHADASRWGAPPIALTPTSRK